MSVPSTVVKAAVVAAGGHGQPVRVAAQVAEGQHGRQPGRGGLAVEVHDDRAGAGDADADPDHRAGELDPDDERQRLPPVGDLAEVGRPSGQEEQVPDADVVVAAWSTRSRVFSPEPETCPTTAETREPRITVSARMSSSWLIRSPESYRAAVTPPPRVATPRASGSTVSMPGATSAIRPSRPSQAGSQELRPEQRQGGQRGNTSATMLRLMSRWRPLTGPTLCLAQPTGGPSGAAPDAALTPYPAPVARQRPVGTITRGTTNPNRLRRVDRWLAGPQAWRLRRPDRYAGRGRPRVRRLARDRRRAARPPRAGSGPTSRSWGSRSTRSGWPLAQAPGARRACPSGWAASRCRSTAGARPPSCAPSTCCASTTSPRSPSAWAHGPGAAGRPTGCSSTAPATSSVGAARGSRSTGPARCR